MNTICSLLTVLCLVLIFNADCDYFLCYENDHYNRPGQMLHVTKDNSSNTKCIKRSEVPKSKCQIQFNASGDHVVLNTENVKEFLYGSGWIRTFKKLCCIDDFRVSPSA